MRILVTGSRGQLGRELTAHAAAAGHTVVGADHAGCDIASPTAVKQAMEAAAPDVVVNCAAWTRVDAAEAESDAAFRVNAVGPRVLATACRSRGVRLCHVSTDFVFDGTATGPIDEWAATNPLGVYGASKLAGEEEVRRLCADHLIVRTAWLYGQAGPNFVLTMLRLGRERDRLRVVADQHGSPTWTGHLAPALLRLVGSGPCGTFHLTNGGATTWHGLADEIVEAAGISGVAVDAITTAEYPTPARRPAYSVLDNRAWRLLGERPLPTWQEGLRAYVAELAAAEAGSIG